MWNCSINGPRFHNLLLIMIVEVVVPKEVHTEMLKNGICLSIHAVISYFRKFRRNFVLLAGYKVARWQMICTSYNWLGMVKLVQ